LKGHAEISGMAFEFLGYIFAQLSMQPVNYNSKARFNNENTRSGLSAIAFTFAFAAG
jgi:hypothetical protein